MVTPVAMAMKRTRSAQCSATKIAQQSRVIHSMLMAITLTLSGIALYLRKLEMYGPSCG